MLAIAAFDDGGLAVASAGHRSAPAADGAINQLTAQGKEGRLDVAVRWTSRSTGGAAIKKPDARGHAVAGRGRTADRQSRRRQRHARASETSSRAPPSTASSSPGSGGLQRAATAASSTSSSRIRTRRSATSTSSSTTTGIADAKVGPHRQTAAFYDVLPAADSPSAETRRSMEPEQGPRRPEPIVPGGTRVYHYLNGVRVLRVRAQFARSSARLSRRASSRTSRASVSCRMGSSCFRITAIASGIAISRSCGSPTAAGTGAQAATKGVQVVANESGRRVDVTIDGKPFTSYIWPDTLKKPVLYPILTAATGTPVTRGFPLEPATARALRSPAPRRPLVQPRRRQRPRLLEQLLRHPGRSRAEDGNHPAQASRRGQGRRGSRRARGRDGLGQLGRRRRSCARRTRFVFSAARATRAPSTGSRRSPPSTSRSCSATTRKVCSGLRVRRELEQPADKPELFTDASGKETKVPVLDNTASPASTRAAKGSKAMRCGAREAAGACSAARSAPNR